MRGAKHIAEDNIKKFS